MSTPDKHNTHTDQNASDSGINAWKGGLVIPPLRPARTTPQPATPRAEPTATTSPSLAATAASRPPAWPHWLRGALAAAGVAVLMVGCTLLWLRQTPPRIPSVERAATFPAPTAATTNHQPRTPVYRALTIGINRYNADEGTGWQTLQTARSDAEALSRTLRDSYGFQVQTLLDGKATRGAIMSTLDELATESGEDDAVLVYFAGHGFYDEKLKEGYWIPADARRSVNGRTAKEDWLWNSTLTHLFGAANARHVLVLADACYSGALFRGDEPLAARGGNRNWYERAFAKRSRYLITSGGLEPVLDSGSGHSIFAQQVLNYLAHGERDIFSANDLGIYLRENVARMTSQMVQMGPLPVSEHAGGEFVFVRRSAGSPAMLLAPATTDASAASTARGPDEVGVTPAARQAAMRSALTLAQAGAPRAASKVVTVALQQNAQDQLAQTVSAYLERTRKQEARDELQTLLAKIEAQSRTRPADPAQAPVVRPRVLACLGPAVPAGASTPESAGALYRVILSAELANRSIARLVEREGLASILQEQQLTLSDLADPRARTAIGKLLPASLLLLGDLFPTKGGDRLSLRLVDTETTAVVASFQQEIPADGDLAAGCAEMAGRIAERITALRPLLAPVTKADGTRLRGDFGTYHGGSTNQTYALVTRTPRDPAHASDFTEQLVGTAVIRSLSDFSADLEATWSAGTAPVRTEHLWVKEQSATP